MAKRKTAESQSEPDNSFEHSLLELQHIVSDLEEGSLGLEPSLQRFEQGVGLLRSCYRLLEAAELKIEQLSTQGFQEQGLSPSLPQVLDVPTRKEGAAERTAAGESRTSSPELVREPAEAVRLATDDAEPDSSGSLF